MEDQSNIFSSTRARPHIPVRIKARNDKRSIHPQGRITCTHRTTWFLGITTSKTTVLALVLENDFRRHENYSDKGNASVREKQTCGKGPHGEIFRCKPRLGEKKRPRFRTKHRLNTRPAPHTRPSVEMRFAVPKEKNAWKARRAERKSAESKKIIARRAHTHTCAPADVMQLVAPAGKNELPPATSGKRDKNAGTTIKPRCSPVQSPCRVKQRSAIALTTAEDAY